MNLLSTFKGWRTLIVNGVIFLTAVAAGFGIIPNPIDALAANTMADNAEAVANAADHLSDVSAVSAGVVAAVALVNAILRVFTTTPAGKKTQ